MKVTKYGTRSPLLGRWHDEHRADPFSRAHCPRWWSSKNTCLRKRVGHRLSQLLAGYIPRETLEENKIEEYLLGPAFEDSGLIGAFILATH